MEENKLKKFFSSKIVLFLLLLAFVWLSLVLAKAFYKKHQMDQEISALKTEIEKMDKKGEELNQLLGYFKSQSYLEKEAKDKLNLKKEGENVVMVQGANSDDAVIQDSSDLSVEAAITEAAEDSNLVKWWKYFFKR